MSFYFGCFLSFGIFLIFAANDITGVVIMMISYTILLTIKCLFNLTSNFKPPPLHSYYIKEFEKSGTIYEEPEFGMCLDTLEMAMSLMLMSGMVMLLGSDLIFNEPGSGYKKYRMVKYLK